jgi:hypothetical protein
LQLSERDRRLLAWIGEQYTLRVDLLAVLMAQLSDDPAARTRGAGHSADGVASGGRLAPRRPGAEPHLRSEYPVDGVGHG